MFPGSFETYINPQELEACPKMKKEMKFMTEEVEATSQDSWLSKLSSFHELILIKCCKEEKVSYFFKLEDCVITISTKAHQLVIIHELISLSC